MNPAIAKLEKEIAYLQKNSSNPKLSANHRALNVKEALVRESLKACVEALEIVDAHRLHGDRGMMVAIPHVQNALTLVNRAMGVSHE